METPRADIDKKLNELCDFADTAGVDLVEVVAALTKIVRNRALEQVDCSRLHMDEIDHEPPF